MRVRKGTPGDRAFVERVLVERWGSTTVVSRGRSHDAASLPSLIAESDGEPVGLLTYASSPSEVELVTIDALREGAGVGSALLVAATDAATALGARRIWLVTTNDNLAAMRFYQRRGLRLVALRPGAVDRSRRLKPSIPKEVDGIAVRDEVELERVLARPEEPEVTLQPVTERDRALLGHLLQLYIHDFASMRPMQLGEDGRYRYRYFDAYFTDPQRHAWIIRQGGSPAGFVMVRDLGEGRHDVSEFFVARGHRRGGVGRCAATAAFHALPGPWEVRHDLDNDEAAGFWPGVIDSVAVGSVDRSVVRVPENDVEQAVFHFSTEQRG